MVKPIWREAFLTAAPILLDGAVPVLIDPWGRVRALDGRGLFHTGVPEDDENYVEGTVERILAWLTDEGITLYDAPCDIAPSVCYFLTKEQLTKARLYLGQESFLYISRGNQFEFEWWMGPHAVEVCGPVQPFEDQ